MGTWMGGGGMMGSRATQFNTTNARPHMAMQGGTNLGAILL
jgi:hypothetical protein